MGSFNTCSTCFHWRDEELDKDTLSIQGVCHCGPPTVLLIPTRRGPLIQSRLPLTNSEFSCDQWKSREVS